MYVCVCTHRRSREIMEGFIAVDMAAMKSLKELQVHNVRGEGTSFCDLRGVKKLKSFKMPGAW